MIGIIIFLFKLLLVYLILLALDTFATLIMDFFRDLFSSRNKIK